MAGYTVTALSLDQQASASRFRVVVSITDSSGSGVQNLSGSNFVVHNLTDETHVAVSEFYDAHIPGIYSLIIKTETATKAREYILAIVVTGRHQPAGRMPVEISGGQTLVKVLENREK